MSCNIEVLTTIGEYEPSDFKDAGEKRRIVMELKEALTDSLRDSYQGQIDYFKEFEPDMSETSTDLILGCERPDELKKIATNWNAEIKEQCAKQFEYLEMEMKKRGYESLSSFIREAADENNHLSVQYPASLYELRKALGAFDDHYSYGCNSGIVYIEGVIGNSEYKVYNEVIMPKEILEDLLQYPERYMFINLLYD